MDSWTICETKGMCITLIESESTIDYNSGRYHDLPDIRSLPDALFWKLVWHKTKFYGVIIFNPTEPENDEPQFEGTLIYCLMWCMSWRVAPFCYQACRVALAMS